MFEKLYNYYNSFADFLLKKVVKKKDEEKIKEKHLPDKCKFPDLNCNINCSNCSSNPPMF